MNELQQAKNEIAKEYGYKDFEHFDDESTFNYDHATPEIINKIAIRYHELMSEWISVKIRFPEPYSTVLIYDGTDVYMGIWIEENNHFKDEHEGIFVGISHWKTPQPPKQ